MRYERSKRSLAVAVLRVVVSIGSLVVAVVAFSTARGLVCSQEPTKAGAFYHSGAGDLVLHRYVLAAWTETDEASEWHFSHLTKMEHAGQTGMTLVMVLSVVVLVLATGGEK